MLETLRLIGWAIVLAFALWPVLRSLGFIPAAPDLRDWLISLAAFARRAADRHVGVGFVIS